MARRQFLHILFEDKDLLVVEKPAGLLSEPKADSEYKDIMKIAYDYLRRKYAAGGASFLKLLHRLDRDTSGVLVLAKSKAGAQLEEDFRSHQITRQYTAIVEGAVEQSEGKIDLPLEKGEFGHGKKAQVAKEGKKAVTLYQVEERYSGATVLHITVLTGRTHQIRVHLAHIGHPVIGDKVYGAHTIPFPRQALHAHVLQFRHPTSGKKMRFTSPLPLDMEGLIDRLRETMT